MTITRRSFLKTATAASLATTIAPSLGPKETVLAATRKFDISLAAYSLHRTIGRREGDVPMLDMPKLARNEFDIKAVEPINWMMASSEPKYIDKFMKVAAKHDVTVPLIMIDRAGAIGGSRERIRVDAVARHSQWVDIAADMGCHSIRMNWEGAKRNTMASPEAFQAFFDRSIAPFRKLCDYGDKKNINILVENHGGPSSIPEVLEKLVLTVDHERFGTLPDFGNFPPRVSSYGGPKSIDPFDGVDRLMKYAKAVSAKCHDFDDETGEESNVDFERFIEIVVDKHGYHGFIGIEYEGNRLSEYEGIHRCKRLLDRLRETA